MSPDARAGRLLRLATTGLAVVGLWFALAMSASAVDPTAAPGATAGASPSATPAASPAALPGASAGLEPLASAPPVPTPIPHPAGGDLNGCYDCHAAVNDEQAQIAEAWKSSAHAGAGVTCADCHGGDPRSDQITVGMSDEVGFVGAPDREQTVGLCGSCHANVEVMRPYNLPTDQYAKYWSSVHGQRLVTANDTRVAICTDCHGSHDVKKASDPSAKVFVLNVPELCAGCHADEKRMEPYGIPTDQYAIYKESVHGKALLEDKDVRAPSCASCHGSHAAKPPRDSEVVEVCGKCHTATQALYEESRHAELGPASPKCWTCHGTHDVRSPGSPVLSETPDYACDTCHDLNTHQLRLELDRFENEADRRCDTCHHPDSQIYAQVQGIADALGGAEGAYDAAGQRIEDASRLGMITADADVGLAQAKTSLIQAQAAVHTTKLKLVSDLSTDARIKAEEAQALAAAKVDESIFRREAMVVVLVLIAVSLLFLVILKRQLDRELPGG
jgi:predicted CXXCH cytochrome family protein